MCIPRPAHGRKRNTSTKKILDKAVNTRRVDIEGKAVKGKGSEPTCAAELIGVDRGDGGIEDDAWIDV